MIPIAVIVALLLLPVLHDAVRRPSFRRLAIRNINRRRGEAALVVLGSMLGTAIITASLVTSDTIDGSISDIARTDLGPIDELVFFEDPADADVALSLLTADPPVGTDGVMRTVEAGVAVASVAHGDTARRAEPRVDLAELDITEAQQFGSDPALTGFADVDGDIGVGDAVIVDRLADDLGIADGDSIDIFAFGQEARFTVREVVEHRGAAGFSDVYVAPGTVVDLSTTNLERGSDGAGEAVVAEPPSAMVLVSNDGGIFDSAAGTDAVVTELETTLGQREDLNVGEIFPVKEDLLADADAEGKEIGSVFQAIGSFSVIAGILLLVNLFVMLAEERKSELGMLRAVGMKRNHLLRSFGMEGAIYSVVSSALGALLGILVGWVIVRITFSVFGVADDGLQFVLTIKPASILLGMLSGVVISTLTVWATSIRISRLNVISAIRDLPDPVSEKNKRGLVFGLLGVVAGSATTLIGFSNPEPMALVAGPALVAVSSIPLLGRFTSAGVGRIVTPLLALVALIWGVSVFKLFPDEMEASGIGVFVVQGVVLVASAVLITSTFDRLWTAIADTMAMSGRGLSTRLGLAYPLARKVRTGLLLSMYSLVIFMMVFLSSFTSVFGAQAPGFVADISAGNDMVIDSNRANPATVAELEALPEVTSAVPLLRAFPDFMAANTTEPEGWAVAGFDESLLAGEIPRLATRLERFTSDREVFEAVLLDPSLAIPNDFFLADGAPGGERLDVGDTFTMVDPATGAERELTVAAYMASDSIFNGVFVAADVVRELSGDDAVANRHYATVADGIDATAYGPELAAELLANGAEVRTFEQAVNEDFNETASFISLLRGFLGLGLVIGIAGLGVVMVRAVRERRRQIGMLRAMGVQSSTVGRAFMIEAMVITIQGILIGAGLGLLTSWSVIAFSTVFGQQRLPFVVPWVPLLSIAVIPLLASLAAVVQPASRASKIRPAAALRIAD